jgi:hypothetical protein
MFGNLHGWLISLVLAAAIIGPIGWIVRMSRVTAAQGIALDPANLGPLSLPIPPGDAWALFTEDADAGPAYQKVIDHWDADAQLACEQFVKSPGGAGPAVLQPLIEARHCERMTLFSKQPAAVINYDSDHPPLENLYAAGEWAYKAGLSLHLHGKSAEAQPYLEAAFALGAQLYRERVVFDECLKGMSLLQDAAEAECQTLPAGSDRFDTLSDFENRLVEYRAKRITPMQQMISSVDPDVIAHSAGDVIAVAAQSAEPMWRVEATLKLGRFRYNAGTMGDQIGANQALRKLAEDHDPRVAMAAQAARELTIQTYRMIH